MARGALPILLIARFRAGRRLIGMFSQGMFSNRSVLIAAGGTDRPFLTGSGAAGTIFCLFIVTILTDAGVRTVPVALPTAPAVAKSISVFKGFCSLSAAYAGAIILRRGCTGSC